MFSRKSKKEKKDTEGLAFVGCLFIGLAIGALYNRWDIGPFLGLGMGFIAMMLVKMKT